MIRVNRKNKIGVTLLLILLITSLVALVSFAMVITCSIKIHNLEKQIDIVMAQQESTEHENKIEFENLGEFKLTAYCACEKCCGKSDGITKTGTKATQGRTIAVDPKVIPYGTEVVINGHTYIAEDCGGAIKGNRVDLYFESHSEALAFGIQYADVYRKV